MARTEINRNVKLRNTIERLRSVPASGGIAPKHADASHAGLEVPKVYGKSLLADNLLSGERWGCC